MGRVAILLVLAAAGVSLCLKWTEPAAGTRDDLIGWYELRGSDRERGETLLGPRALIPVHKAGGAYYTVCLGWEAPLRECAEGLEWGLTPSSMAGTTLGFDRGTRGYYLRIVDGQRDAIDDSFVSGEKQRLVKTRPPAGLLDPTCAPPRSTDSFIGWFQPVWLPGVRLEVRKEGMTYRMLTHVLHDGGVWKPLGAPQALLPHPDRLGFTLDREGESCFVYNDALKRFEVTAGASPAMRMPLARVPAPVAGKDALPAVRIGIPAWH